MDPLGDRVGKVALLAAALFWLAVWGVIGWRAGVAPGWLAAYALALVAYGALGYLGFSRDRARRWTAAAGALALTILIAVISFADARIVGGGLAVAISTAFPVSGGASVLGEGH